MNEEISNLNFFLPHDHPLDPLLDLVVQVDLVLNIQPVILEKASEKLGFYLTFPPCFHFFYLDLYCNSQAQNLGHHRIEIFFFKDLASGSTFLRDLANLINSSRCLRTFREKSSVTYLDTFKIKTCQERQLFLWIGGSSLFRGGVGFIHGLV